MSKSKLKGAPTRFRSGVSKGLSPESRVDKSGGRFGAGVITGFAVVTRGEALGHGLWIDDVFVASVSEALAASDMGLKSRFTHPDMSGDGLAKGLGRTVFSKSGGGITRGDLHLWKTSRESPDGDLGGYVLERAVEDPDSFGSSIVFDHDYEAQKAFAIKHGAKEILTEWGPGLDFSGFKSPDPDNAKNLPHARLGKLRAVDIVDDPAANPSGLFHRDATFKEAEGLLEYALGFSDRKPELVSLDIDPDRVGGFVRRFLNSRGLEVTKLKGLNDGGSSSDTIPATTEGATPDQEKKPEEKKAEGATSETATAPAEESPQLSDGRKEAKRFVDAFGSDKGGAWYAEGLSFEDASARYSKELREENKKLAEENSKLRNQIKELSGTERDPLSTGGADEKRTGEKTRSGFGSRIRFAGASKN